MQALAGSRSSRAAACSTWLTTSPVSATRSSPGVVHVEEDPSRPASRVRLDLLADRVAVAVD